MEGLSKVERVSLAFKEIEYRLEKLEKMMR